MFADLHEGVAELFAEAQRPAVEEARHALHALHAWLERRRARSGVHRPRKAYLAAYRAANRAKHKAYMRKYNAEHREELKARRAL